MNDRGIRSLLIFILLTYAISWTIWWVGMSSIEGLTSLQDKRFAWYLLAGSFGPTVAALVSAWFAGGRPQFVSLVRGLFRVRVNWRVYAVTFLLLPCSGILVYLALGISARIELWKIAVTMIPLVPVNALLGGVIFGVGPLGEEMGWRGFLQSRLLDRFGSFFVAVVVGLAWAFWHLPAFRFADFRNGLDWPQFAFLYPISMILIAFIMGHLWRWSHGSLFIVIMFHAVLNTVTTDLMRDNWWDHGTMNAMQIYIAILGVFAITATATEVISRTLLREASKGLSQSGND